MTNNEPILSRILRATARAHTLQRMQDERDEMIELYNDGIEDRAQWEYDEEIITEYVTNMTMYYMAECDAEELLEYAISFRVIKLAPNV